MNIYSLSGKPKIGVFSLFLALKLAKTPFLTLLGVVFKVLTVFDVYGGYPNSRAEFRAEIEENVICNIENVICNTFWTSFATRIGVQLGGEGHLCEI